LQGWQARLAGLLAGAVVVLPIAYALDLPARVGLLLYQEQIVAAIFTAALTLAFLVFGSNTVGAVRRDRALAAAAFLCGAWVTIRYPTLLREMYVDRAEAIVLGLMLAGLTLEAVRRTAGWLMAVLILIFGAYAFGGALLPGAIEAPQQEMSTRLIYLVFENEGLLGRSLAIVSVTVVIFIMFGRALAEAGAATFITDLAKSMMGRRRGGPIKVAILSSGVLGSITGSVVSNVMATGTITIPLMKRMGFPAAKAGAIEAVASTGGQLMPPVMGAAAFLIPEFLGVSYTDVVVAALVPGMLFYLALLFQADCFAQRLGTTGDMIVNTDAPAKRSLLGGAIFVLPFLGVVGALAVWRQTPQAAGVIGIALSLAAGVLVGYRGRRLALRGIGNLITSAGIASVPIVMIGAAAGLIIGVVSLTGIGVTVSIWLSSGGLENLLLLLVLTGLLAVFLGLGLPTVAIYVLVATVLAPSLITAGVEPIAAHLFVFYGGVLCMITPPVAFASLAGASLAGSGFWVTCMAAVRFGWPVFILPFLFVLTPGLLLIGSVADIVIAIVSTAAGLWLGSAGIEGYWRGRLGIGSRLVLLSCGVVLLYPKLFSLSASAIDMAAAAIALLIVYRPRASTLKP
jgi:TRAP transporter 4TM/12TM fusion protein